MYAKVYEPFCGRKSDKIAQKPQVVQGQEGCLLTEASLFKIANQSYLNFPRLEAVDESKTDPNSSTVWILHKFCDEFLDDFRNDRYFHFHYWSRPP